MIARFGPVLRTLGLPAAIALASTARAQPEQPVPELELGPAERDPPEVVAPQSESALEELLAPGDGRAAGGDGPAAAKEAAQYRDCLAMAEEDPRGAVDFAFAWQSGGGTLAAKHCASIAYIGLERFGLAAERLNEIARDLRTGRDLPAGLSSEARSRLLAQIYAQMGNARLLAGDSEAAYSAFSSGLAAVPDAAEATRLELLVDRARTLGAAGDYETALEDLKKARALAPNRGDIALYMASAQRALGELDAALDSVEAAFEAAGDSATARLERGNIRRMRGERSAAKRDWQEILERWPDSPAAAAARVNLDALAAGGSGNAGR